MYHVTFFEIPDELGEKKKVIILGRCQNKILNRAVMNYFPVWLLMTIVKWRKQ